MASGIARGDIRLYEFAPRTRRGGRGLTRDSAISYLNSVTVAPVTYTVRGVPCEVLPREDDGMKSACAVSLHNVVTVSQATPGRRVARLSTGRMDQICGALRFSLGVTPSDKQFTCRPPRSLSTDGLPEVSGKC